MDAGYHLPYMIILYIKKNDVYNCLFFIFLGKKNLTFDFWKERLKTMLLYRTMLISQRGYESGIGL